MKLPRWLVVSLLTVSVFAVLGSGVWWWLTWPKRTAESFAEFTAQAEFQDAAKLAPSFASNTCTVCHRVSLYDTLGANPPADPVSSPIFPWPLHPPADAESSLTFLWQLQRSNPSPLQPQSRTLTDILVGRQQFELSGARVLAIRGCVARVDCQFASPVMGIRFSPDGTTVTIGTAGRHVKVWNGL
jgi:hypothetical protein